MRSEIVVATDAGIVVLHDSAVTPAAGAEPRDAASLVRHAAEAGGLFFIDSEDAVRYRVVVIDEELPPELLTRMEPAGGSFLLQVPTGRIAVTSGEAWAHSRPPAAEVELPPGTYALRAHGRKPFDKLAYDREMAALAGDRAWRLRKGIDAFGEMGCLAILAVLPLRLVKSWQPVVDSILGAMVAVWALYFLLRLLPTYREVERRRSEHEALQPHYAVTLQRVSSAEGLAGGGIRA